MSRLLVKEVKHKNLGSKFKDKSSNSYLFFHNSRMHTGAIK